MPIIFPLSRLLGNSNLGVPPSLRGSIPIPPQSWIIRGTTYDSAGAILGSCTVKVYRTSDDVVLGTTISAADGTFSLSFTGVMTSVSCYIVAYLATNPDVMGTTVNTIQAS